MRFNILLACIVTAVSAKKILFFAHSLDTLEEIQLGSIDFDQESSSSAFLAEKNQFVPGPYCIGTRDLPGKECLAYLETDGGISGEFVVYIDSKNELAEVSFFRGKSGLSSTVRKVTANVVPNLNPSQGQQVNEPVIQKVTKKRVVENEAGEKVEIEEEVEEEVTVDDKSWIQKNWMYVVPPLLLFLVFAPEDKPAES